MRKGPFHVREVKYVTEIETLGLNNMAFPWVLSELNKFTKISNE